MSFDLSKCNPRSAEFLAKTKANFPGLIHSFDRDGCNFTALTITDAINNAILTRSTLAAHNTKSFTALGTTASGLIAPGTNPTLKSLYVHINESGSASHTTTFGNVATYGLDMSVAESYITVQNGTDYHTHAAIAIPNPTNNCGIALAIDWSGNTSTKYVVESTDTAVQAANGVSTLGITEGISQANLVQQCILASTTFSKISGFYVFHFANNLPSDATIRSALCWMANNLGYIAPHFKGMA